jgi:hypothetical protein
MTNPAPRTARLQEIRDRWFSEPLTAQFPPLGGETAQPPSTCDEFVRSDRLAAAFSSLHEAPEAAGMTAEQALAHDRQLNTERFGVDDPRMLLQELGRQFDRALTGQVDPDVLKKAFVVLDTLRADSLELAAAASPPAAAEAGQTNGANAAPSILQASYSADAVALGQAQSRVAELATELGISLPLSQGVQRKK